MAFLLPAIAFEISIGYIIHAGQDVSGECCNRSEVAGGGRTGVVLYEPLHGGSPEGRVSWLGYARIM